MSLGIYGWFFEQFIGKQGLEYANNGNGRKEAATAVAFDENSAAKNILTAWKDLNDKGFAPVVGKGGDAGLGRFLCRKICDHSWFHSFPETDLSGCKRKI